jgi:calcium-dependent protein kinase
LNNEIDFSKIENKKARDFVMKLLQKEPNKRISAEEALEEQWLSTEEVVFNYIDDQIGVKMFSNMSKFIMGDSLRRSVYTYIISKKYYNESNIDLLKLFKECDINNDGKIGADELLISYGKYFPVAPEEQIEKIQEFIDRIDINKSGFIEYAEFLTINNIINQNINKKMLKEVFDFFDFNKNGSIQIDDLKEIFEDFNVDEEKFQTMLIEFDKNNDQEITFTEFYEILTSYLDDHKLNSHKNTEGNKLEEGIEVNQQEEGIEENKNEGVEG